jgi:alpha,alpha-trehalose phosphorylase
VPARTITPPPTYIYPPDPWKIVETRFSPEHFGRAETFFALSNGYLGLRGTFEEGRPALSPGTFINGFHETWPIVHAEDAYGLARTGQTIVNVPDFTLLKLYIDDEPLFLPVARVTDYRRVLDMEAGTLTRELVWSTPSGKHVRLRSCRLVSLEWRHLAAITYEVTVLDHSAPLVISSRVVNHQDVRPEDESPAALDPRLAKTFTQRVLNADVVEHDDTRLLYGYRTTNSGMTLGFGVDHVIDTENPTRTEVSAAGDLGKLVLTVDAQPGNPVRITKFAAFHTSRSVPSRELVDRAGRTLDRAMGEGFERLVEEQREHLDRFWERADVRVVAPHDGDGAVQQAVRWNLFQLAQATWRAEGSGIPAKGLTGQAYEGHYFWDTEVYVLPFLAYTQPRIARNLLRFRYSMLGQARERARTVAQRGALFPWRTINGEEASAYYQAGTAQYHINADVAYAIRKYVDVRGDVGFLGEVGGEVLVETARMWEDLGFYGTDGRFYIHGVTGPDEYTTVVNNNTFTNLMARLNLNFAAHAVRRMREERPDAYTALVAEVGLSPGEVESWEAAAEAMYVPFDEARGINPQDDTFLDREVWDIEATPKEKFPLLLHYHPLVIYRFQVIKQADIVLAMFLLGNEFTAEQKRRNFDYYDPLTTGDSSLSACVQSIVAAEIGHADKALEYFDYALMMDLGDVAGNVSDGVHIASTGGVWMALVFGFGGVRDFDGELAIDPHLPASWTQLEFPIRFQDRQLRVVLTHDEERYEIEAGDPLQVTIRGERRRLSAGSPLVVPAGGTG